jgi:hypothetical protein
MVQTYTDDQVYGMLKPLTLDTDGKIKTYQEQVLKNYTALLDKVTSENVRLNSAYDNIKNNHSADAQHSKYVTLSQQILKTVYTYSFWIYMVLSLVLAVFIYYKPFSIFMKLFFFAIIFGFPFYIYFIENLIYTICMYLYHIVRSMVYNNGFLNTNIEYTGQKPSELSVNT